MITEVQLYVIRQGRSSSHELLKAYAPPAGEDRTTTLRHAHDLLVTYLNVTYPNQWVYAYGNIEANEFTGQFQWKEGGWGGYVPALVYYTDPEVEEARRLADEKRHAEKARIAAEMQVKVDALPPMVFCEGGEARWNEAKRINSDPYGGAIVAYAERWARLMQAEIVRTLGVLDYDIEYIPGGKDTSILAILHDIAQSTSDEADTELITGGMYGAAVHTLSQCWIHGMVLRRWHNGQYGVENDEGTVNPALLTININA